VLWTCVKGRARSSHRYVPSSVRPFQSLRLVGLLPMVLCRLSSNVSSVNRSSILQQDKTQSSSASISSSEKLHYVTNLLLPTPASPISRSLNKWS
jgi:hypothetical protein